MSPPLGLRYNPFTVDVVKVFGYSEINKMAVADL